MSDIPKQVGRVVRGAIIAAHPVVGQFVARRAGKAAEAVAEKVEEVVTDPKNQEKAKEVAGKAVEAGKSGAKKLLAKIKK